MNTPASKVVAFVVLTFVFSSPFYYLIASAGTINAAGGLYIAAIMWCPGVAGLCTRLFFQRNFRGIGWGWGSSRYHAIAYAIPVVACIGVYGFAWATGIGDLAIQRLTSGADLFGLIKSSSLLTTIILTGTVVVLETAVFTMGEEIGWRGLMFPELARVLGYSRASLAAGLVWAVFHYPLMFYSDYNSTAPLWYATVFFTLGIVAGSFIVGWLRLRSASVWTAVIMHSSHNTFTALFNQITISRSSTAYFTTEFGAGLAVAYGLVAYGCWRHRNQLRRHRT
jgi:uncharacterized protein